MSPKAAPLPPARFQLSKTAAACMPLPYTMPQRTAYCFPDPFGIKPLYYCEADGFFAFSSEPRAFLQPILSLMIGRTPPRRIIATPIHMRPRNDISQNPSSFRAKHWWCAADESLSVVKSTCCLGIMRTRFMTFA